MAHFGYSSHWCFPPWSSHTISPGDGSLFAKENVKVSLRQATKFLHVNRKKTFTTALWLLPSESCAFPFCWSVCIANKSTRAALRRNCSCFAAFHPPTSSSLERGFPRGGCAAADVRVPGNAEQTPPFIPQPTGAKGRLAFIPAPTHSQTLSLALLTAKGNGDGSSRAALVITAEIISVSVYLPGIAPGTHWQHPVVAERELPHKSFPMLPHSFAIQSVRLSLLAGRSFLGIEKVPVLSSGSGAQDIATLTSASRRSPGTSLAFKPPCFRAVHAGSERMPGSYTGQRRNHALPSPASPTVCPTDSYPLSCGNPFLTTQPPNLQKPTNKHKSIMRSLNALVHT